jgi:hypothetical protein
MTSHMPITNEELLDSLMRAALRPTVVIVGTNPDGSPMLAPGDSPLASMVGSIVYEMSKTNSPVRDRLVEAVHARVEEIAQSVASRMPDSIIVKKQMSSYPPEYRNVPVEWMQAAICDALAEALRPKIADYVAERFPVLDLDDMRVSINIEVVKK